MLNRRLQRLEDTHLLLLLVFRSRFDILIEEFLRTERLAARIERLIRTVRHQTLRFRGVAELGF